MATTIIGIDPGAKGAIAMVCPMVETWDLPRSGRDFADLMRAILGDVSASRVYIEKAQSFPGMGVAGAFNYGRGYGEVLGVLASLGVPAIEVAPAKWKRALNLTRDKEECRVIARRLFPEANVSRMDKAEALLIAEFGRRQP